MKDPQARALKGSRQKPQPAAASGHRQGAWRRRSMPLSSQSCNQKITISSRSAHDLIENRPLRSRVVTQVAAEPTGSEMDFGLEQIGGPAAAWFSAIFIAASIFGSMCALGAAWAACWFVRQPAAPAPTTWPDVSILKPLFGAEAQLSENIETYFHQDYPGGIQYRFRRPGSGRQRNSGREIAD